MEALDLLVRVHVDPASTGSATSASGLLHQSGKLEVPEYQEGAFAALASSKFFRAQQVPGEPSESFSQAGILLKNQLTTKDETSLLMEGPLSVWPTKALPGFLSPLER